ncbi:PKD domain-containing protein [Candidatus Berkelbacteria bacterium]|nr:PKD domain-containing protein [Candidatus Berkelbacteria bacterium]
MAKIPPLYLRVRQALVVSALIFSASLGYWSIQTFQLSQADIATEKTTLNWDDKSSGDIAGDAYADKGVEILSPDGGGSGATLFAASGASAACPSYKVPSEPNILIAKPSSYAPLVIKFTQGRVSDSMNFSIGNAGNAEVSIEAFDIDGKSIATKTVNAPGGGQCVNSPVTLAATTADSGIAEIRLKKNAPGTTDGFGIDDFAFSALHDPNDLGTMVVEPTTGNIPLKVTATYTPPQGGSASPKIKWNFGDGTTLDDANAAETHTYTSVGTFTVTLIVNGKTVDTKTVTTTQPKEEPKPIEKPKVISVSLTTSKSIYKPAELVEFTLKNTGEAKVQLPNGAPFKILQGSTAIFEPISTQALIDLSIGQSKTWTWDQKKSDGLTAASGNYIVTVSYLAENKTQSKSASFTISQTQIQTVVTPPTGTFAVTPTTGTVPFEVAFTCTGDTITNLTVDFGDGIVQSNVTCPTTLKHTYTTAGNYTITVRQGEKILGTQAVTAKEPVVVQTKTDGKGAPVKLASSGANLIIVLLIASILSGIVSYFIIRRPFHGNE